MTLVISREPAILWASLSPEAQVTALKACGEIFDLIEKRSLQAKQSNLCQEISKGFGLSWAQWLSYREIIYTQLIESGTSSQPVEASLQPVEDKVTIIIVVVCVLWYKWSQLEPTL